MAFGARNTLNTTGGNETSQSSTAWAIGLNFPVVVGSIVIVAIAIDNRSTADGATSDVTSVSDARGNLYVKAGEQTNTVGGAAADGATISVWYSKITTQLENNDTVTTTYSGNVTAKACVLLRVVADALSAIAIDGTVQTLNNDNADAGSMSISGLTSREHFYLRAIASETDVATVASATSGYSAAQASNSGTGGSEKGHMSLSLEHIVETSTGSTSDPTMTDTTADRASLFMAFYQIPKPPNALLSINQANNRAASF